MGQIHELILQDGIENARKKALSNKNDRLCVDAAYGVMADEKSQIGIAHTGFAMAALPHKKTQEPVWERDRGQIKLRDVFAPLKLALAVYPEARVEFDEKKGLTLFPSPPPVSERRRQHWLTP